MAFKRIDLFGQRFGKLVVIAEDPNHVVGQHKHWRWVCQCDCGNTTNVSSGNLRQGRVTSCRCLMGTKKRPYEWLYNRLVQCATREGWEITIQYEDFLGFVKQTACHYCGAAIRWYEKSSGPVAHGSASYQLDRKDSFVGYLKDNIVVCCTRCNRGKSNIFTYDEWVKIGKTIAAFGKTDA